MGSHMQTYWREALCGRDAKKQNTKRAESVDEGEKTHPRDDKKVLSRQTRNKRLTEYALFRLEKCPFKVNKKFCSFCKVHCYKPDMRERIKDVMKWAGPRMIFTHPVFAMGHVFQMIKYKKKLKKEAKAKGNV